MRLGLRSLDLGLRMSRLTLARLIFGAGLAVTLISVPLMVGIGPYIIIPGLGLLFVGVALAPRKRR